jgi:hypothetical protein
MGDDSQPRRVLSVQSKVDDLYRITAVKGDSYVVGSQHVLSLRCSNDGTINKDRDWGYRVYWIKDGVWNSIGFSFKSYPSEGEAYNKAKEFKDRGLSKGSIYDIKLNQYLTKSLTWKNQYKGYLVGVQFQTQSVPIDPYIIGYWLGDGTGNLSEITTDDHEIINYFTQHLPGLALSPRPKPGKKTITYYIRTDGQHSHGSNYLLNSLNAVMGNSTRKKFGSDGWRVDGPFGPIQPSEKI